MKSVRINNEMRKKIATAIVAAQGYEEQKEKARDELLAQMRVTAERMREAWYTKEQIAFIDQNPEMFHRFTLYSDSHYYYGGQKPRVEMKTGRDHYCSWSIDEILREKVSFKNNPGRVIRECERCVELIKKIDRIEAEETKHTEELLRYLAQFNTTKQLVEAAPKFEKVLDKLFSEQTSTTAAAPAIQYAAVQSLVNGYLRAGRTA
jgi:hypothetical protein